MSEETLDIELASLMKDHVVVNKDIVLKPMIDKMNQIINIEQELSRLYHERQILANTRDKLTDEITTAERLSNDFTTELHALILNEADIRSKNL